MSAKTIEAAPTSAAADAALGLVVITERWFSRFDGTRAQLEAEGILPKDFEWPIDHDATPRWQVGPFDFWLHRERPPGAKGPRKQFSDCDWFSLGWGLTDHLSLAEEGIARKAQELKDAIYRNSAEGQAKWSAQYERYRVACQDKEFQAFKATIPGLVAPKRGRRPKCSDQPQ
ncbi:MAG: hypothetical protein Q7J42_06890 [Sulfuritalea sp.]|nr:hypothetical protein [Sulfuritalea sp.]